jgi:SAM-dependent methyltransferase
MSMDPETRTALAASFGGDARDYAASRPTYPGEAVRWMVGAQSSDVLDVGAGAGALARVLRAAGHRVTAAEPSAPMVDELVSSLNLPTVRATAERLPFAASSFDAVTVASAFHWFAPSEALPELARVLRAAGALALAWNINARNTDIDRRLGELLSSAKPPTLRGDWGTASVTAVEQSPLFEPPDYAEFALSQRLSREGLVGLVASRSYVMTMPPSQRQRLLNRVRMLFDDTARTEEDAGGEPTVELMYRTQCWRFRRRSAACHPVVRLHP